jgi:hypothetical protein
LFGGFQDEATKEKEDKKRKEKDKKRKKKEREDERAAKMARLEFVLD